MFQPLAHLRGRDVADVLVRARKRIERVLARANDEPDDDVRPLLTRVTGQPSAGPAFKRGAPPVPTFSSHELCARLEGYDLHAATRAGADDDSGREALLRYVLRPPIAQERVVAGPDGLVRIVLKKRFSDGTLAVDMDRVDLRHCVDDRVHRRWSRVRCGRDSLRECSEAADRRGRMGGGIAFARWALGYRRILNG